MKNTRTRTAASSSKSLKTVESLVIENSRLKKELQQALDKIVPSSYITLDVAGDVITVLKEAGLGKDGKSGLFDMIIELLERYRSLYSDVGVYQEEYKKICEKNERIGKVAKGEYIDSPDKILRDVMYLRGVLEAVAIRLERLAPKDPELNGLHNDVITYLENTGV